MADPKIFVIVRDRAELDRVEVRFVASEDIVQAASKGIDFEQTPYMSVAHEVASDGDPIIVIRDKA